ncbi:deoxycytidylate deaminase [Streptomyces sp. NPDC085866]|uniref:deoxycytidylate deaminase n=1 Tax=Streptomyces sp. NPDC085866 TaxID=3365736 RepID=UPI0037CCFC7C
MRVSRCGGSVPDPRPGWDDYFLGIAEAVAARADCTRSLVGAVMVAVGPVAGLPVIVGTGYNGAPPGVPGCLSEGACPRGQLTTAECAPNSDYSNCVSDHAERNCVRFTPREHRQGATLYVTREPCPSCRTLITAARVGRVVWPGGEWIPSG